MLLFTASGLSRVVNLDLFSSVWCHILVAQSRSLWDASEFARQGQSLRHGLGFHVGLVLHKDLTRETPNDIVDLIDAVCMPGHVSFRVFRTWHRSLKT